MQTENAPQCEPDRRRVHAAKAVTLDALGIGCANEETESEFDPAHISCTTAKDLMAVSTYLANVLPPRLMRALFKFVPYKTSVPPEAPDTEVLAQ